MKTSINVLLSIFLTAILVAFVNLGISQFYPQPSCNLDCSMEPDCSGADCKDNACNFEKCTKNANAYQNDVFYILTVVGLVGIVIGFFGCCLIPQIIGLSTGFILIIEGMVRNSKATLLNWIASGLLIVIICLLIWKFSKKR
jgi:hypothetical protein